MSKKSIIAKMVFQDGKRADGIAGMGPMMEHVKSEPGTLEYHMLKDSSDENALWMYELYADQDAVDAHLGSDAMKALGPAIGGLLAAPPDLIFVDPILGKGL